jgi:hypothetical protein
MGGWALEGRTIKQQARREKIIRLRKTLCMQRLYFNRQKIFLKISCRQPLDGVKIVQIGCGSSTAVNPVLSSV